MKWWIEDWQILYKCRWKITKKKEINFHLVKQHFLIYSLQTSTKLVSGSMTGETFIIFVSRKLQEVFRFHFFKMRSSLLSSEEEGIFAFAALHCDAQESAMKRIAYALESTNSFQTKRDRDKIVTISRLTFHIKNPNSLSSLINNNWLQFSIFWSNYSTMRLENGSRQ